MSATLAIHAPEAAAPNSVPADPLAEAVALLREIRDTLARPALADRLALDAEELAAALGVSERMVWTMNSTGEIIAPFKAGSRTLWDVAELRRWMLAERPARDEWERVKRRK